MRPRILIQILLLWFFLLPSAYSAQFGFFVEPYGAYGRWGKHLVALEGSTLNPKTGIMETTYTSDFFRFSNFFGWGIRTGVHYQDTYFASLDLLNFPSVATDNASAPKWGNTLFGITAAVQLPAIPLKFWIGFNFLNLLSSNLYLGVAGINDSVSLIGNAFKIGTGVRVYSPIYINLEAYYGRFTSYFASGSSSALPDKTTVGTTFYLLSISTPFTLVRF